MKSYDELYEPPTIQIMFPLEDEDEEEEELKRQMSRLSMETSDGDDADVELSDDEENNNQKKVKVKVVGASRSYPGSPDRRGWDVLGYSSETDRGRRRPRQIQRRPQLAWRARREQEWERRKGKAARGWVGEECRLLVRSPGPQSRCLCMNLEEVKACRELGLEIPSDWRVEVPGGFSATAFDYSRRYGLFPIDNWKINSPGDDPEEVKARLKLWAQAVALASASQFGSCC